MGWDDWGKPESHSTVDFVEQGSHGPGASNTRPEYVHLLD